MLTVSVYNIKGEEVETVKLPAKVFGLKVKDDLISQAVNAQVANSRIPYAHVKDRSEVRGGGRKPWRQKGTGRARHGSIRSPIWSGGGVTFGPRNERNFSKKINKKAKRKALLMALSSKARDKELIVLDSLKLEKGKTKLMAELIKKLKVSSVLIATSDKNVIRANQNLSHTKTIANNSLNVVDLLSFKHFLLDKESIKLIEKIYGNI